MSESIGSLGSSVDRIVGDGVEAAVRARHSWRLRRLGWDRALTPPGEGVWAAGDPPPRDGCSLEVLIDGAAAFPVMAEAIENARECVHVAGWHLAPYFELIRGDRPGVLGELLAEAAERIDVRVLVWAGAPVPAFRPTRKEVRGGIDELTRGTRIRCEPDPREHPFHCHHEKTVVVDGEVAFVGGIDMTDYAGDRYDTSDHLARRRLGWHDVGTRVRGPAVTDVHDHRASIRPALHLENTSYCISIERIRAQSVNRLRRKCNQFAPSQESCSMLDFLVRHENGGFRPHSG